MMENEKVLVKLYGESFKIHALEIKSHPLRLELFNYRAKQLGEPLESALLNVDFFKDFSGNELNSVQDMIQHSFGGLMNNPKAKIEIKRGRKILQKFSLDELFHPKTLFPLFNAIKRTLALKLNNNIFLIEKEVGLIGHYEVDVEIFDISLLKFFINDIKYSDENYQLLMAVGYNAVKLESIKSDTLVTYQHIVSFLNE